MTIDDAFDIDAPLERVWALLKDVPRVATCIPNAELTEVNWVPVNCIPSPESPANRMTTRSSSVVWWRVAVDTSGPLSRDRPAPRKACATSIRASRPPPIATPPLC